MTQIPARKAAATPSTVNQPTSQPSATAATSMSSNAGQPCMMQPSAANQSLLKANPVGGASDAVSAVRSKVEAEGNCVLIIVSVMTGQNGQQKQTCL